MKIRRRILVGVAAVPLVLLALLLLAPVVLKGRVTPLLQRAVERNVDAQVSWGAVRLSLLRDFPNVTLRVRDVAIAGNAPFEGDTLLRLDGARLVLDLGSVWRSRKGEPVVIRAVDLDAPRVGLVVLEDGRANWDIARPTGEAGGSSSLSLTLRQLAVNDGALTMDDRKSGLEARVAGLDSELRGDFARTRFTLRNETSADSVSVRFAGVPYLSRARVSLLADVDADMEQRRFTLRDNEVRVNELVLAARGWYAAGDTGAVDLEFEAPGTAFADILSLVPAIYAQSFASLETSGTMAVRGHVRGGVGGGAFPGFELMAQVSDGRFKYPDLPLPARDIAFELSVTNPGGDADSTVVRVNGLHVVLGADPIDGTLVVRTPVSDPDVDVRLAGRVELENIGRTVKLEDVEELRGVVVADASMRARQSAVEAQRYDDVHAAGRVEVTGFSLKSAALRQPVEIEHALLELTPQHAELSDFRARSGRSDVAITATIDNLLGYAMGREVLRGEAQVRSSLVDLNEWRSEDEARAVPVPDNLDFAVHTDVQQVVLGTLAMRNARGALHVRDRRATLDDFRFEMFGGNMGVTGFYETTEPATPRFDVALDISEFDVPTAFNGLATMRALAPVAAYARGRMNADVRLAGALGTDLSPVLEVLTGIGNIETSGLVVEGFPAFERLAERLSVPELRSPGFRDLKSSFEVRDGRLRVKPFDVTAGPATFAITGSNGFDQSIDYDVTLRVPRSMLGSAADAAMTRLASQTGRVGLDLSLAETIGVGVKLTGSVRDPELALDIRDAATSFAGGIRQSLEDRAQQAGQQAAERVDSAAAAARQRAEEEAARIVAEAEERAAELRDQARALAERARLETHARADSLAAAATSPAGRIAARTAADRLKREADAQAERAVREADARAGALIDEARRRAEQVRAGG